MGDDDGFFAVYMIPYGCITPMLQALLPLKYSFQKVTSLCLDVAEMPDEGSLALLSCMFGNLASLDLAWYALGATPDFGCMQFLENWGSLKHLTLPVDTVPSDCLVALQSAGVQHRSFVLQLAPRNSACRDQIQLVAGLGQVSQRVHPDVCLNVG